MPRKNYYIKHTDMTVIPYKISQDHYDDYYYSQNAAQDDAHDLAQALAADTGAYWTPDEGNTWLVSIHNHNTAHPDHRIEVIKE